jgi:hypothetical protein
MTYVAKIAHVDYMIGVQKLVGVEARGDGQFTHAQDDAPTGRATLRKIIHDICGGNWAFLDILLQRPIFRNLH